MSRFESPVGSRYVIRANRWPNHVYHVGTTTVLNEGQSQGRRISMDKTRVVDSISCRQMYLRSYTFSREEEGTFQDKAWKCLGRIRKRAAYRRLPVLRKARDVSRHVLLAVCSHLHSCIPKANVPNLNH